MSKETEHLQTLSEIRNMMERSSRFISLSGLSGVFAGIFALIGAYAAYKYLNIDVSSNRSEYSQYRTGVYGRSMLSFYIFFFADALCVLFLSISVGILLTVRKAKQKGQKIWDATAKRMIINLMIPLSVGGVFSLILVYHGLDYLISSVTLMFYGLALLNASKYTLNDIRYLGILEICLGLLAAIYTGYGLLFWALGFGVLHIVYGIVMYYKYEK